MDSANLRLLFDQLSTDMNAEREALLRVQEQVERLARCKEDAEQACSSLTAALESSVLQRVRVQANTAVHAVRSIKKAHLDNCSDQTENA